MRSRAEPKSVRSTEGVSLGKKKVVVGVVEVVVVVGAGVVVGGVVVVAGI